MIAWLNKYKGPLWMLFAILVMLIFAFYMGPQK
jgi:hypothetical protein